MSDILLNLYNTVKDRQQNPVDNSYTCYLLNQGLDKILKKCGEECSEVIIAAKNGKNEDTIYEIADLFYHLTVLMVHQNIPLEAVFKELLQRNVKIGNLKLFHQVDKNT